MGDPEGPPLRRGEVLEALNRHGVEFVMVGGQASQVHGAERRTFDLDICLRWTQENLDRMGEVLVELDAGLRIEGMDEPFPVPHRDAGFLETMEISTWRSTRGDVDVLRGIPSPGREVGYDELVDRAEPFVVDGQEVLVADLGDIITSKETLSRPRISMRSPSCDPSPGGHGRGRRARSRDRVAAATRQSDRSCSSFSPSSTDKILRITTAPYRRLCG